jgi:hypothetical protein
LPAAVYRADNPARRRKHFHVGLTKTSMFWILADSSTPVIFISDLPLFVTMAKKQKQKQKQKAGSPDKRSRG